MQYIDLEPFEMYLQSRGLVEEKYIPHYSRWVLRFLRSGIDPVYAAPRDLLQSFSDQLARDDSVADWQLKQAMRAAELYLNVFLPQAGSGHDSGTGAADGGRDDRAPTIKATKALDQMRELMKLRLCQANRSNVY